MKHAEVTLRIVLDATEGDLTGERLAQEIAATVEEMDHVWLDADAACYRVRYAAVEGVKITAAPPPLPAGDPMADLRKRLGG